MLRNRLVLLCLMAGLLGACGSSSTSTGTNPTTTSQAPGVSQPAKANNSAPLPNGDYPVQQVSYDDSNGQYSLMLLNTPQGAPPVFRTDALQMARLSDDDTNAGKASYFNVASGKSTLFLSPDFRIEYVPSVAQNQVDPSTGQDRVVYVRQRPTYWSPFATGVVVGAIASDLFTPRYYVPPAYVVGQPLVGYGGYGNTYDRAVSSYQSRYNEPPRATRRQQFRTTGSVTRSRTSGSSNSSTTQNRTTTTGTGTTQSTPATKTSPASTTTRKQPTNTNRSTGSGFGSSTLRNSGGSSTSKPKKRSGFGSFGGSRRRSSGGFRRRRRR
ncbi:MAG: hypothetical protein AAF889_13880 [Cyanobacteria bacterium P01_D01_bin.73]